MLLKHNLIKLAKIYACSDMFRTILKTPDFPFKIHYHEKIMLTGSCFTESIGEKLRTLKFQAFINPAGIVFNPASVASTLEMLISAKKFTDADLGFNHELYFSFQHHGRFSHPHKETCLRNINTTLEAARQWLAETKYLFITFGTAWVYELKNDGMIVANCHKQPASLFNRRLMTLCDITSMFDVLLKVFSEKYPQLKIIFTISPVRHVKDGFVQNQLSKSTLILAVHQLCESWKQVYYFPSYEIMMDDLRDYRFYAPDMVHPSEVAVDYIWQHFSDAFFDEETKKNCSYAAKIVSAAAHSIFQPQTQAARNFARQISGEIERIEKFFPPGSFDNEKTFFNGIMHG